MRRRTKITRIPIPCRIRWRLATPVLVAVQKILYGHHHLRRLVSLPIKVLNRSLIAPALRVHPCHDPLPPAVFDGARLAAGALKILVFVIPAKAGIQFFVKKSEKLDSSFRWNDELKKSLYRQR
jgi:hypothetical protein